MADFDTIGRKGVSVSDDIPTHKTFVELDIPSLPAVTTVGTTDLFSLSESGGTHRKITYANLKAKLRDDIGSGPGVYVEDYGAVGDGSTNDRTAIAAAIAAAASKKIPYVFFKAKNYAVASGFTVSP